jgi:hypothetical protein
MKVGSYGVGGPEDKEPLPKRLKDVKKERLVIIEKGSALCENVGVAYIDLSVEKGRYKLYYMRIENEQRIMSNSRLEVLGSSSTFSVNKMTNDESQMKVNGKKNDELLYEESYSYTSEGQSIYKNPKRYGSPYHDESSSLDSAILMK